MRQWETEVRRLTAEQGQSSVSSRSTRSSNNLPQRPEKRAGESNASFNNRLRQWEYEVRQIAETNPPNTAISISSSGIPARPEKRAGESDAAFNNRMRAWEAEIRSITTAQSIQNKEEELQRLKQELQKLSEQVSRSSRTDSFADTGSENMLVIPSGEINTEELLTINEDMNVMSQILFNELNREIINATKIEWVFSDGKWVQQVLIIRL